MSFHIHKGDVQRRESNSNFTQKNNGLGTVHYSTHSSAKFWTMIQEKVDTVLTAKEKIKSEKGVR